jgi:hypothetical protein
MGNMKTNKVIKSLWMIIFLGVATAVRQSCNLNVWVYIFSATTIGVFGYIIIDKMLKK